jgi:putative FmdB family regulatory protein
MPIFEYICQECEHEFETLVFGLTRPSALNVKARG